jgi:hypothetical protein
MQMPSSKIPSETRQRLLNSFVPIGERLFEHTDRLFNAGFKAFMPLYEDSIAGCDQDKIELHQQFLVEAAKEEIGNGDLLGVVLWGAGTGYKSELLTQLRRARDAEGHGRDYYFQQSSRGEKWRCWLSPCWIERWRIGFQEPERDTRLLAIRNTRLKEEKAKETARIVKSIGLRLQVGQGSAERRQSVSCLKVWWSWGFAPAKIFPFRGGLCLAARFLTAGNCVLV